MAIAGDAQTSLPALIEAVRMALPRASGGMLAERESNWRAARAAARERTLNAARYRLGSSPISTARLTPRSGTPFAIAIGRSYPSRCSAHCTSCGKSNGITSTSVARAAPAWDTGRRRPSVRRSRIEMQGRLAVNIQKDGDLMYVPGALWTAAHHRIPLLSVMHNNRAYHQELMHLQRMAARRQRGVDGSANVGNVLDDPAVDFAGMARSMGVWASGPIENPRELGAALREALAMVDAGEPALIDVVSQPR